MLVKIIMKVLSNLLGNNSKIKYTEIGVQKDNEILNIKEYVDSGEVYSTSEVKTNKVWIDNKPIYRKVLKVTPLSQSEHLNPNIINLGEIINVRGMAKRINSYFNQMPNNYTNYEMYLYDYSAINITYKFSDLQWSMGIDYFFVILEYTKTTDEEVSNE